MENKNFTVTNDMLYAAIEASIDRITEQIIDEFVMSDDEMLLDDILDNVQECLERAEVQKKIYHAWIYEHTIPDEFIYDPGGEDVIDDENDDTEGEDA
jgi:hypothetical protein